MPKGLGPFSPNVWKDEKTDFTILPNVLVENILHSKGGAVARSRAKLSGTHIFADDLLESRCQIFPVKHLDVLLDVARLGSWESHDNLEELLTLGLPLRYCQGAESFQIPPDPILFLNRESFRNQLLQKINGIHTGNKALFAFFPIDATDTDARWRSLLRGHGLKRSGDCATGL